MTVCLVDGERYRFVSLTSGKVGNRRKVGRLWLRER